MPDEEGIVFAPETFAEHDGALSYVRRLSRTRSPLGRQKRYPRVIPGYWGKLAAGATISAASGLSLGSGTVKLCDREGTVFDADESVDVANAGGELTGGAGGAIMPLEWTDGEWSTCVCGGEVGCITTICVVGCSHAVKGATVTIKSGSSVIASGTTDESGCITLGIGTAGAYTVVVSAGCFNTHTSTETLACGGTTTVTLAIAPGCTCGDCCPGGGIPTTLFMTDSLGTTEVTYDPGNILVFEGGFSSVGWSGGNAFPRGGLLVDTPVGLGSSCLPGSGNQHIYYQACCFGGRWYLERYWLEYSIDGGVTHHWTDDPIGGGVCNGGGIQGSIGSRATMNVASDAATCSPLAISGPTTTFESDAGDPGGGAIALSQ